MHVCDVFGQGRAHAPDNKIISVCDKTLPHPGGSRRPVHRKPLSTAAVCAARDQTLASSQSSVAPHAYHSDNSPCTERPMGNCIIERHRLRHVVGYLLHGLFGFMRAGEFSVTHVSEFDPASSLCLGDIAVDHHQDPSVVQVRLKQSKTDPFRRGVSIYLGRTQTDLCPVVAILAYIAVRPAVNGPLFVFKDGSFLTRDRLVSAIRRALSAAGINTTGFSGHSFRIGAATTAAVVGVEDSTIKMLGRWESSAYQRYLRTPRETLAAISARLVTP